LGTAPSTRHRHPARPVGHRAEYLAAADQDRAVEQALVDLQWQAHGKRQRHVLAGIHQLFQGLQRGLQQGVLLEQVIVRVG
jgi:hypothetical protein